MKKSIFVFVASIAITGCAANKCGIYTEVQKIDTMYFFNPVSNIVEDVKNHGVFYYAGDSVPIQVVMLGNKKTGEVKTIYKVLNK